MKRFNPSKQALRTHEARAPAALFLPIFLVFLLIALVAQVLMLKWRTWLPGSEGNGSLLDNVRSSVYTVMSYIS
jgi:light-harvesting complex 1 beta chain